MRSALKSLKLTTMNGIRGRGGGAHKVPTVPDDPTRSRQGFRPAHSIVAAFNDKRKNRQALRLLLAYISSRTGRFA